MFCKNYQTSNRELSGTEKSDRVAYNDLKFWLPRTKKYLREGIKFAPTFHDLVEMPIPHIGYILSIVVQIIRKGRNPEGIRLSNGTLKTKVDSWQLIIRDYYKDVDSSMNLINSEHRIRSFNVFSDPQLLRLKQALMIIRKRKN